MGFFAPVYSGGLERRNSCFEQGALASDLICVVVLFLGSRRLLDTEDELSDIQSDSVPSEVRDWLASTFTRKMGMMKKKSEEKPRFRSIVHVVQAGIFVER